MRNYQIFQATPSGQIFVAEYDEDRAALVGEKLNQLVQENPDTRYNVLLNGDFLFQFQGEYCGQALLVDITEGEK